MIQYQRGVSMRQLSKQQLRFMAPCLIRRLLSYMVFSCLATTTISFEVNYTPTRTFTHYRHAWNRSPMSHQQIEDVRRRLLTTIFRALPEQINEDGILATSKDDEDDSVERMASFLSLRMGQLLLKQAQEKAKERKSAQVMAQDSNNSEIELDSNKQNEVDTETRKEVLLEREIPGSMHGKEGDRIVALRDEFAPESVTNKDQTIPGAVVESAKTTITSQEVVQQAGRMQNTEANSGPNDDNPLKQNFVPPVPTVISLGFGRSLPVVTSGLRPLREEMKVELLS